jgi:hypothetical protein
LRFPQAFEYAESVRRKGNPAELYKAASFGLAWSAGLATGLFAFAYFWLLEDAPRGWFNNFMIAALPGAAVVAVTYAIGYYFLIRKGISRDQRLVDSFLETLGERSIIAPEVTAFAPHPRDVAWSRLLDGAESVTIVARWFDTWSNENGNALRRFFERGGQLEAVMLDPANEAALATAVAQHQGFAEKEADVDAARKVSIGLERLAKAAERAPGASPLTVRLITNPRAVMSQTLMRFKGPGGTRLVAYPLDNFRDAGHRSPAIVLDPTASHQLKEFWESERRGFEQNSRRLAPDQLARGAR